MKRVNGSLRLSQEGPCLQRVAGAESQRAPTRVQDTNSEVKTSRHTKYESKKQCNVQIEMFTAEGKKSEQERQEDLKTRRCRSLGTCCLQALGGLEV